MKEDGKSSFSWEDTWKKIKIYYTSATFYYLNLHIYDETWNTQMMRYSRGE